LSLELKPGIGLSSLGMAKRWPMSNAAFRDAGDTPLTDYGRQDAWTVGVILARSLKHRPRPRCVSSPQQRARTTMQIVLEMPHLPRVSDTDDRLMEIDLGAWAGLTDEAARARDPAMSEKRLHDTGNLRAPGGGENYAMVADRIGS
jgi:broad specificity phosphatase PhoE